MIDDIFLKVAWQYQLFHSINGSLSIFICKELLVAHVSQNFNDTAYYNSSNKNTERDTEICETDLECIDWSHIVA